MLLGGKVKKKIGFINRWVEEVDSPCVRANRPLRGSLLETSAFEEIDNLRDQLSRINTNFWSLFVLILLKVLFHFTSKNFHYSSFIVLLILHRSAREISCTSHVVLENSSASLLCHPPSNKKEANERETNQIKQRSRAWKFSALFKCLSFAPRPVHAYQWAKQFYLDFGSEVYENYRLPVGKCLIRAFQRVAITP